MESYSPLFGSIMKGSPHYLNSRPFYFNFDKEFLHIESDLFEFHAVVYHPRYQRLLESDISADIFQLDSKLRNLFFTGETVYSVREPQSSDCKHWNLILEIPPLHSSLPGQDPQQLVSRDIKENWERFHGMEAKVPVVRFIPYTLEAIPQMRSFSFLYIPTGL
jgi:hypothetical protein